MAVIFVVLTLLVVAAIGLVAIGGVTAKLAGQPPLPLFDLDEAVEYVADRLPFDVAAELSYDDVRQLMAWHLDYLEQKGVAYAILADLDNGEAAGRERAGVVEPAVRGSDPAIAEDDEGVAFVLGRAHDAGIEIDDVQVVLVLEAEMAYLEAIRAIGTKVDPPPESR